MARLDIYIGGERLDVAENGIAFTFTPLRFCGGVLPDGISVDFTLPNTANNRRLLGVSGELYTGFPSSQKGMLVCGQFTKECRVDVKNTTADGIAVAVFAFSVPSGMADRLLWRLVPDTTQTIFDWRTAKDSDYGYFPIYTAESGHASGCYARHPFMSWGLDLKQAIESACGCVIDDTAAVNAYPSFLDLGILADGKRLCPENPTQCLYVALRTGEPYGYIYGGQHAVNDLESDGLFSWYQDQLGVFPEDWLWDGSGVKAPSEQTQTGATSITFDRDCEATITIRAIGSGNRTLSVNGTPFTVSVATFIGGTYYEGSTVEQFQEGDVLEFPGSGSNDDLLIMVEYSDYTIKETDYDRPLAYMPVNISFAMGTDPNEPDWSGWSYSYFGLWANAPKRSVRSLLTTMAWAVGCGIGYFGNELRFTDTTAQQAVNVRQRLINTISNEQTTFGGTNIIKWANDTFSREWTIGGLEGENVIFESEFQSPGLTRDGKRGVVDIYTVMLSDGNQNDWPVNYEDLNGVFGLQDHQQDPTKTYLMPFGKLSDMGLEKIAYAIEVQGEATDDISSADMLNAEGVGMFAKEIVYNPENQNFTYKAIVTSDKAVAVVPPTPGNEYKLLGVKIGGEFYLIGKKDNSNNYNLIGQQ